MTIETKTPDEKTAKLLIHAMLGMLINRELGPNLTFNSLMYYIESNGKLNYTTENICRILAASVDNAEPPILTPDEMFLLTTKDLKTNVETKQAVNEYLAKRAEV